MACENLHDDERGVNEPHRELDEQHSNSGTSGKAFASTPEDDFLARSEGTWLTRHELIAGDGLVLPPPEEMTDATMPALLVKLLTVLTKRRMFVMHTDHLSDKQLYARLWRGALRDVMFLPTDDQCEPDCIDIITENSEEATEEYLRYYAGEKDRARWAMMFPESDIPPHEDPPYDRDRHKPYVGYYADDGMPPGDPPDPDCPF